MASKKSKARHEKNLKYCACCGKAINGHDIILASHAVDYVKKQGYDVYDFEAPIFKKAKDKPLPLPVRPITFALFFLFVSLFSVPTVSAYSGGLAVNFSAWSNIIFLVLSFGLAIALFFFRKPVFSALILLIDGFIMLMSDVSVWFSLIPILASILVVSGGKK